MSPDAKLDVAGNVKVDTVSDVGIVDGNTKVLVHDTDNIVKYKSDKNIDKELKQVAFYMGALVDSLYRREDERIS